MTFVSPKSSASELAPQPGPKPTRLPDATPRALVPSAPETTVSVIVVAYHGARWIPACLETLADASRERVRLVVVDNGGNDGCIPREHPAFEYVVLQTPRPLGFTEANNFALQQHAASGTAAVCFLNQDTRSDSGWIDDCFACLRDRPDVGAVTPMLRTYDRADWDAAFLDCARQSPTWSASQPSSEEFHETPRITAAAMLVRTSALRQAGPFDPIFGSYYEDYDLCLRLRRFAYRVGVCNRATVCHFSGASTTTDAAVRKRMRQILRNRAILAFREAAYRHVLKMRPEPAESLESFNERPPPDSGGPLSQSAESRWPAVAKYLTGTLPRNIARGALGTPSSQPLAVQFAAYWDLLRLWRRLVSTSYDEQVWHDYLDSLDWSQCCSRELHDASRD